MYVCFCLAHGLLKKIRNSIYKYKHCFYTCFSLFGDVGLGHWSTSERHLWLFILSRASLPKLTTKFHPHASVSLMCGITDVYHCSCLSLIFLIIGWNGRAGLTQNSFVVEYSLFCYCGKRKEREREKVPLQRFPCANLAHYLGNHKFIVLRWVKNFCLRLWLEHRAIKTVICLKSYISCLTVQLWKKPCLQYICIC